MRERTMAKSLDVVVKGGLVVSGTSICRADIGIKGEQIVSADVALSQADASRVIDASGKYVMPGVIDVHTHPVYEDDMGGLSVTAAYGGTTTLIHYAYAKPGMKVIETIKKCQEEGLRKSVLDFGLHGAFFDPASQIEEIPRAIDLGVTSFKMFMTYAKLKWMTDDYHLTAAMDLIAQVGGLAMVHAESGLVTDYLEDRSLRKKENQKEVFLKTRPDYLEAEAIFRALSIGIVMNCPLYVVHLSTAKGAEVVRRARAEGQLVYTETCPQYLALTDADLQRLGPLAKIGPPLRTDTDRMALWEAIQQGIIDVIASDHAPKAKKMGDPFFEAPFGSPQAETMLAVSYDEGVNRGRIGPCKLVQLLCENPSKIFGIYPRKGSLQKGSDADIVIFDPNEVFTIRHENQHSGAGYSVYEGRGCLGKPQIVMQRGKIVVEGGELKGKPGEGKFVSTRITKVRC
jgi:dihydropyrimidinase